MTRERLQYLVIAAVIAVIATWIARSTYWDEVSYYQPPKGEAARDPYYATRKLLARWGVRIHDNPSLRGMPPRDEVLFAEDLSDIELRQHGRELQQWVEAGGRLVIPAGTIFGNHELQAWTGISMTAPLTDAEEERLRKEPCQSLEVRIDGTPSGEKLRACISGPETAALSRRVPAWSLSNRAGLQILRLGIGQGSVTLLDCDCLLKNASILREDHARILVEAVPLRRGDGVRLQRATDAESLLAMLWRLAAPAIVTGAVAIGLLIWRHWPRFGPPAAIPAPVRRSLAEQIRANAQFAWRTRQLASLRNVLRRAVERAARRRVSAFQRLDSAQRLSALAARTGLDAAALRAALTDDAGGEAQAQSAAIELLERARRALEAKTPTT